MSNVFYDNFAGSKGSPPNPAHWGYDIGGGGWGNNELEEYTDSRFNSFLDGAGHLVIRARREAIGYTSARLTTLGKFSNLYGTWEARIRLNSRRGLWPAWWAMGTNYRAVGWPACGEVDMLEDYGWSTVETTVHIPDVSGARMLPVEKGLTYEDIPVDTRWHTYRMQWQPSGFIFTRDGGKPYLTVRYPTAEPMFMLLNLAVGGAAGTPPPGTMFPVDMLVDYVRVWTP